MVLKEIGDMTLRDMHQDLMERFYENTIDILKSEDLSKSEREEMLREACSTFSFGLQARSKFTEVKLDGKQIKS